MKFLNITVTAMIIATASMLAGSYLHARAVEGDTTGGSPKQLNYVPVVRAAGSRGQTIQLSPELRDALINEIQRQTQAPVTNVVIVITPQGEVRYLGTMQNPRTAGGTPGPSGWTQHLDAEDDGT